MLQNSFTRFVPFALVLAIAILAHFNSAHAEDYTCGYYEPYTQQVCVSAGCTQQVWCAPVYQTTYSGGCYQRVQVTPGYYRSQYVAPRYETRTYRRWVPNTYVKSYVNRY